MPTYIFQRQVVMCDEALQELEVEAASEAEARGMLEDEEDEWEEVHSYGATLDEVFGIKLLDTF